ASDNFGTALAGVGRYLAVSAPNDDRAGLNAGAVYLMDPDTGLSIREIDNPTTGSTDLFGTAVAASGSLLVVGAPGDNGSLGGVFVFDTNLGTLLATVRGPNTGEGEFGRSLAASGNRALAGAFRTNTGATDPGSAYLIDIDPASATFGTRLQAFQKSTTA